MRQFVQDGGQVLTASSDYPLLSAYSTRGASGALLLLVLHKDPSTNFNAQIAIKGFVPDASCAVVSYAIAQDEAARTNAPPAAQDLATNSFAGAGASFNYSFPPYSMTLLTLAPAPPVLTVSAQEPPGSPIILELQGQPGTRYVIQTATDLQTWTSVSTNTLVGKSLALTNTVATGPRYWRGLWQP